MAKSEWPKCNILLLTICFWIIWYYWIYNLLYVNDVIYNTMYSDFFIFYSAGKALLSQANPYSGPPSGFLYPPPSLPFFGFFALFGFAPAAQIWTVMYLILFLAALLVLTFTFNGERRSWFVSIAALLFLTSSSLLSMMGISQSDLLIASLTLLSLGGQRLKHNFASAAILSMGTLMKGSAIFFLIYFVIFHRDLRYLFYFLVSTLAIVGASLLVVPIGLYWYYIVNVLPTLSIATSSMSNQSIVGAVSLAGMSKATPLVSLAGFVLFGIFSFYVNSNRWADAFGEKTLRADAMFLMNGLLILLLIPRSLFYPYVWVILPLALFLSGLLMEELKRAYLALVCIETFLLNSTLSPPFLNQGSLFPSALIGNLTLVLSLIPIYLRPSAIFPSIKNRLIHRQNA